METERDVKIRELAYALWEERGRPSGASDEHWLEAERSFAAGSEGPAEEPAAPPQGIAPQGNAASADPAGKTGKAKPTRKEAPVARHAAAGRAAKGGRP